MEENWQVKLAETEQRAKSNTHRIDQLEKGQEDLNRLTTAVEVMVQEQRHIRENVTDLGRKLDVMEHRPIRRAESLAEKAALVLVSALITYVLTQVGLA